MEQPPRNGPRLVDWEQTIRRLRRTAVALGSAAFGGWLLTGLAGGGVRPAALGGWLGGALLVMFVAEVVIVGGSALRGMLRAGDRGERLAGRDVGLLPPQLRGRRRQPR